MGAGLRNGPGPIDTCQALAAERIGRIMAEKPWDGRFTEKTDKRVEAFTASHAYDRRL